jgi:hypothetical protein
MTQGATTFQVNGRTYRKQANGSWANEVGDTVSAAEIAQYQSQPAATQAATPTVAGIQTQLADLQAQQAALTKYGLTDTNQLSKDASGAYVPIQTAKTSTTTSGSVASQVTAAQTQLSSLQAQAAALKVYNLTDTNQLTQDASGKWVPTAAEINNILTNGGMSADTIAKLNASGGALTMATVLGAVGTSYTQNNPVSPALNQADLDRLFAQASADPEIATYYGDQLKTAQTEFMNAYGLLSASTNTQMAETQRQQAVAMKNLQNQQGLAGMAYSGFKKQATEQLGKTQESVIESSKQQLQSNLESLGNTFESQYGTAALPPTALAPIQGVAYQPIGGVTGSQTYSEKADIAQKYEDLKSDSATIKGITK